MNAENETEPTLLGLTPDELMVLQSIFLSEPVKPATIRTFRAALSLAERGIVDVEWGGSWTYGAQLHISFTEVGSRMVKKLWIEPWD